jgi:hypothetical protein
MEIVDRDGEFEAYQIETPDGSFFVPSPDNEVFPDIAPHAEERTSGSSSPDVQKSEYSGLRLERYTIHPGRFGVEEDSSLLEALVESAFDDFKSVRIVSEGAESVHAFVRALSEELLNCESAVHIERVTILSPSESQYVCRIKAVYPAIPQFRHLAQTYEGVAVSDKSMLDASLHAACNAVGRILLTFQPEGFELPERAAPNARTIHKEESPAQSTVDSERGSSLFDPMYIPELPRKRSVGARLAGLFTCGAASTRV